MKEDIAARLNRINSLEDRLLLKNVLHEVFFQHVEHSEKMYRQLEERVFAEMAVRENMYDIYTSIVPQGAFDPVHYFLRPMQPDDLISQEYDMDTVLDPATGTGQALMKVFFQCSHQLFREILAGERLFPGEIVTDQGRISAGFRLYQDRQYLDQISRLYELFLDNNIPWKTVNHPYIFRFAKVYLKTCARLPAAGERIREIVVDFGEYGPYVHYDMVPLWNIEILRLNSTGFPIPCRDKINYEHAIPLTSTGIEHGYLAILPKDSLNYTRRTPQELTVVASIPQQNIWEVLRIINPAEAKKEPHLYPVLTNAARQNFGDIMARHSPRVIRTEAEIKRLVSSYIAAESINLVRVAAAPRTPTEEESRAEDDPNFFLRDEIRRSDYHQRLILYFSMPDKTDYLAWDLVNFIAAEVQLYYPDYKCEGIVL